MDLKKFEDLRGHTLKDIQNIDDEEIIFTLEDDSQYRLHHIQDCCESVVVEDIAGDLRDLVGSPILLAEEVSSEENPPDAHPETIAYQDSFTWTFYKLSTIRGSVTIRWYGESNGYYSESVDFDEV